MTPPRPTAAWSSKQEFVALVNTPGLARLRLRFDHQALRLRVQRDDAVVFDGVLDPPGRERLASVIGEYVRGLDESPVGTRAERLPLRASSAMEARRVTRIASRDTSRCMGAPLSPSSRSMWAKRRISPSNGSGRTSQSRAWTHGRSSDSSDADLRIGCVSSTSRIR
jgi:hypothetical protein